MINPTLSSKAVLNTAAVILVVDDTVANRQLLAALLRKTGYQVLTAPTAVQAEQQLAVQLPDLIMLDIMMPGLDGFALCRKLQADPKTAKIPIIFLSALSATQDKVRAFEAGGTDYVTKPYQAEEVLARVAHQIKIARLQKALEREKAELQRSNDMLLLSQRQTASIFNVLSETLPGMVLDDKYRIEEKIGAGGFGVVYRAVHLGLQRPVALKIFRPPSQAAQQEALSRFRLEGISTCRVNHPNAVSILDAGMSAQGIYYLAMELLSGSTLDVEMKRTRQLTVRRCMQIMVPLCEVLVAAHSAGIVHRDIKAENIMLHKAPDGEIVKVLDFGIAKLLGEEVESISPVVTGKNTFVGTAAYVAPERFTGEAYDGRSDVFSAGVLLHEMLTGQLPFTDRDQHVFKVMFNHLHGKPTPLRVHAPELPARLEELVLRMLARNKEVRPTAQDLLADLNSFASTAEELATKDGSSLQHSSAAKPRLTPVLLDPATAASIRVQWGGDSDSQVEILLNPDLAEET